MGRDNSARPRVAYFHQDLVLLLHAVVAKTKTKS